MTNAVHGPLIVLDDAVEENRVEKAGVPTSRSCLDAACTRKNFRNGPHRTSASSMDFTVLCRLVSVIVIIPCLIPALVVSIVNVVSESVNISYLPTHPARDIFEDIFNILDSVVPFVVDDFGGIFDVLDFFSGPAGSIFGKVLDILNTTGNFVLSAILCLVPFLFCDVLASHST